MNARLVLTTAGSKAEAQRIARALIERHLAACVNINGPIESVYRWKGEIETAEEWLLLIKTAEPVLDRVQAAIRELHSYDLPECIALEISGGGADYLGWIAENVE